MAVCENHSGFEAEIKNLKQEDTEIWGAIETVRTDIKSLVNRPPVWCTFLFMALTGAVVWFARGGG